MLIRQPLRRYSGPLGLTPVLEASQGAPACHVSCAFFPSPLLKVTHPNSVHKRGWMEKNSPGVETPPRDWPGCLGFALSPHRQLVQRWCEAGLLKEDRNQMLNDWDFLKTSRAAGLIDLSVDANPDWLTWMRDIICLWEEMGKLGPTEDTGLFGGWQWVAFLPIAASGPPPTFKPAQSRIKWGRSQVWIWII